MALVAAQSPRSGRPDVLVEQAFEPITALHPPGRERDDVIRLVGATLLALNFASPSRSRNLTFGSPPRFRACWATQAPVGW